MSEFHFWLSCTPACHFSKNRLWHKCFPVNFPKFLRTLFLHDISGRLLLNIQSEIRLSWAMKQHHSIFRSSHPKVFLGRGVLEICSKFTGEHPRRSSISIKLQSNFYWNRCSHVNWQHIFRKLFLKNTCRRLLLNFTKSIFHHRNIPPNLLQKTKFEDKKTWNQSKI